MLRDKHGFYHYTGCIHLHTTDSDGALPHDQVIEIGKSAGLDFLFFTDHMTMKSRESTQGIYDKLIAVVGYEHNDKADKHHFLIFGAPRVYDVDFDVNEYVSAAAADHTLGIIAHPDEERAPDGEYPPYEWDDWTVEGYSGIEVWNQMSEWMERLAERRFLGKVGLLFSPRKFLTTPPKKTLYRWDSLNQRRRLVGIAGPDAHAFEKKLGPKTVTIFPYKVHFKTMQTHVILRQQLSEEFQPAADQLIAAIRAARCYFSNSSLGDPRGFCFWAETAQAGGPYLSGDDVKLEDSVDLHVTSPGKGEIRILRNGEIVAKAETSELTYRATTAGAYRAEVFRREKGWIYSNHIAVGLSRGQ